MTRQEQIDPIVRQFLGARAAGSGFTDYPGEMPATLAEAYVIQDVAIAAHGAPIGGWKVGRIPAALEERFGSDRLAGPIFTDLIGPASDGVEGRMFVDGFGAAEAEFLLRIGTAPAPGQTVFSLEDAAALVDAVHIGFEIASSPFTGINEHGPAVTVSDFGNNNGLLIGPEIPNWRESGFDETQVKLSINGAAPFTGVASGFPDGPLGSVRFLLGNLVSRGIEIPAGTWVSTGAVTGVHQVSPGDSVVADFGPFGSINCVIVAEEKA